MPGGKRPGAGRPKGSANKRTVAFREALERVKGGKGAAPEVVLAEVMLSSKEPSHVRVAAASALMPYLHSKMPTSLEVGILGPAVHIQIVRDSDGSATSS